MSKLPDTAVRRKPVADDSSRLCPPAATPRLRPPEWLRRLDVDPDRVVEFPSEFLEHGPSGSEVKIFVLLCRLCGRFRSPGVYAWASNMARELGLGTRTVEVALRKFESWGFLEFDQVEVDGQARTVYWCRWLHRADYRGREFDLGQGVRTQIDPAVVLHRPRAQDPAQDPALEGKDNSREKLVNVSELAPGGEQTRQQIDPQAMPEGRPAPPPDPLPPDQLADQVAIVARRGPLRQIAYRILEQTGQLPAEFAGLFPPARVETPPPPALRLEAVPPPPSTAGKVLVETLMRRLVGPGAATNARALGELVADRIAEELRDRGWRNCFAKRARLTAEGKLPLKPLISAYLGAVKAGGSTRGKLFVDLHNKALGHAGGPIEGFVGA